MVPVAVFLGVVLVTALFSRRLVDGPVTPPTILAVAALVTATVGGVELAVEGAGFRLATELTLSFVLFVDATRIPLRALRSAAGLPGRLLGLGLPLSIALMTVLAMALLGLELGPALLVGSALSATDAALARVIVESESLPVRIREAVNVESGLNDGLATPVVSIAIALTATEATGVDLVDLALQPLGLAIVLGPIIGLAGGWALRWASRRGRLDPIYAQLAGVVLVGVVVAASFATGAIVFVAAFLAGSAFGQAYGEDTAHLVEYTEDTARLLTLAAFFAFGMALLPDALAAVTAADLVVVVLALTVGRMVPVALALVGTGLTWPSVALVGWFGPRGLATVLFVLIAVEELGAELPQRAVTVMVVTVLASLVLHGASARPLSARYASWLEARRRTGGGGAEGVGAPMAAPGADRGEVTRTRR